MKYFLHFLAIWLLVTFAAAKVAVPLKIVKSYTKSSSNSVSVCARVDRYFGAVNGEAVKPYIKVLPKQYFKVKLSYDEICIDELKPQTQYTITIDKQIPIGSVTLDKTYTIKQKTGDFAPDFSFKSSGYILPAKGDISIPLESLNINRVAVSLYRINRNNLIGAVNEYGLFKDISSYDLTKIKNQDGYKLWEKKLLIKNYKQNVKKITAIPVGKYIKKQPGVYILVVNKIDKDGTIDEWDSITQWFMVSDIGVFTVWGEDGLHIYTKHLSNAAIYDGVKLELVSKNNETLGKTVTKNGEALFKKELLNGKLGLTPQAVYAYGENGDFTVINLSKPALDLTDRGDSGRDAPQGYDGFIFSNRGIFKPGSKVPYNLLVRDSLGRAVKGIKLTLKLLDSRGVEVESKTIQTDNFGYAGGEFKTSKEGETGRYTIVASIGKENQIAKLSFLVEDFVPPKIEVKLIDKPKELTLSSQTVVRAAAKYLTGDVLANPKGEFKVILHKAKEPFKKYKGYQFGKIDETYENYYAIEESFTGDSNGTIELPINLKEPSGSSLPISAYIKVTVNEPGGRPVSRGFDIFFNDKSGYIGIKPQFLYDSVDLNMKPAFLLVYLQNSKASAKTLHYKLIEEEPEWNWESDGDGWKYYKTYSDLSEIKHGDISVQNRPTPFNLEKLDWGDYRLEISDDSGIITSYRFSVGYDESSAKVTPDRLPLATDKKIYPPNGNVRVNITPKFSGPVLVSVANSKIIETKEVQAKEGVPLNVDFKINKQWGSSAYILAAAFRAQSKKLGASRAIGIAHIAIEDSSKVIKMRINTPKKIKSNSKLRVKIKASQKEGSVVLAVVDKGILNITNYKTPDPAKFYWGKKRLGVELRDIYGDLIKAMGEHGEFEVGAGDEMGENLNKEVTTNKREVVALISKPLKLQNGEAAAEFNIPNFQGSLKVMAVAWNKKAVGSSDAVTLVKDPISLEAYMPRFLANGDSATIFISAKFDNEVIKPGSYKVKIASSGGIKTDKNEIIFNYDGKNSMLEPLPIKAVKNSDGAVTLQVYKGDTEVAQREFKLAVRSPYPQNYVRRINIMDGGGSLNASNLIDSAKWQNIASLKLTIFGAPLIPLKSIENELTSYCCRCAEQTTSRAFPYLGRKGEYAKARILSAIERLKSLQKLDGSFGLWVNSRASVWVSAFVLDFLTRAKEQGYKVSEKSINEGLNWLQNSLYKWSQEEKKQEADAYALYVLARNGKILMSDILHHVNNTQSKIKSALAWGHLASALNIAGERQKAKEIFQLAKKSLNGENYYCNYGGKLRDKAGLIVLLKEAKFDAIAAPVFVDLALDLKNRKYLSTQEMSQILRAGKYLQIPSSKLKLKIGDKIYNSKKAWKLKVDDISKLPNITNLGEQSVWYNLEFVGTPSPKGYNEADNNGFVINKQYYTMDGKPISSGQIAKNQRIVVVISGEVQDASIDNPLIIDFLPSGFEIENPDISGVDELEAVVWLKGLTPTVNENYRDDRFAAALDLNGRKDFKAAYIARAVTLGKFAYPPALIEDMYKPRYRALSKYSGYLEIKNSDEITALQPQEEQNSTSSQPSALESADYTALMTSKIGDLSRYSVVQLNHLRNGIFAQIGLDFSKTNPALNKLYSAFEWYKPTISSGSVAYSKLSPLQKENVIALLNEEKKRCGGSLVLADFYKVKVRLVTKDELKRYSKRNLRILRNSLIARYGLVFKDEKLTKIFKEMPWYKPDENITASEIIDKKMSDIERTNIQTILSVEKE